MPFADQDILNWVQHEAESGMCTICAAVLHPQAHGTVWMRGRDMMTAVEPLTRWERCTPA